MKWGDQYQQKPVLMSTAEANRLLGGPHSTAEAISAGFAAAVRAAHPDTAAYIDSSSATIEQLKTARDLLLHGLNQGQEIACKMCGGSGRVATGFGAPCAACQGEGIIRG